MVHKDKDFGERVARLGFPLLQRDPAIETNETLAEVVQSDDTRLWEGFPVMLANSLEAHRFDYLQVRDYLSKSTDGVRKLDCLVALSLALYQALGVDRQEFEDLKHRYQTKTHAGEDFVAGLQHKVELNACGRPMSVERLRTTFQNYYLHAPPYREEIEKGAGGTSDLLSTKRSYDLEYALSQLFSTKQKELVLKKFRGEKLTKTEREYYSRTVRKKLSAVANEDLHRLAVTLR